MANQPLDIRFTENEFRPLLDRDKVLHDVRTAFPEQVALLRDMTNYGSNLIPRCFGDSGKELKDLVVIAILLRQVVAMLDGIELLASHGAVHAAGLQARALFEASVYIDWILKKDGDKKAKHYYVHNIRRQRMWARRTQVGSPEATAFAVSVPDLPSFQDPGNVERARSAIAEFDRVLSQPAFRAIDGAFDACRRKDGSDVSWYKALGMRSIGAVMTDVGRSAEYGVFYTWLSGIMHSSDYLQHIKVGKGEVTFEPIRHLKEFKSLFMFSIAIAFHTYRTILQQYRPGEVAALSRKYLESWQKPYREVPDIKYEVTSTRA